MRALFLRSLLAVLPVAAACGGSGGLAACPDEACRAGSVRAAWDADPGATARTLAALPDLEQEALVRILARGEPEDLDGLCRALTAGSTGRGTCQRLRERPHLRLGDGAQVGSGAARRAAPGPATRHPPVPVVQAPDEAVREEARGALSACAGEERCLLDLVDEAARAGRAQRAGALCLAARAEALAQGECAFRAAEVLAEAHRWRGARQVMALCSWSGSFAHGCVQHGLAAMLPDLPPADGADAASVAESLAALAAIQEAVGPSLAPLYADLFWSQWTAQAFLHSVRLDGRLLALLPGEAVPHVRAAAAWQLVERQAGDVAPDLEAWATELSSRLADPGQGGAGARFRPLPDKQRDFWSRDLARGGEASIPAAFCLGPGRRPLSPDPALDLRLALLEASGRVSHPPPPGFYEAIAAGDGDLLLRWTALRILGAFDPARAAAFDRPDLPALLRARARRLPGEG